MVFLKDQKPVTVDRADVAKLEVKVDGKYVEVAA
jgi:hypothetical protein